jgi:hypothetical protein
MCEIVRQPRPEKIPVPTGQQNAVLAVQVVRIALLTTTTVATKPHTALDREQARIVVLCTTKRRTASGNHTDTLTKIVEIKGSSN